MAIWLLCLRIVSGNIAIDERVSDEILLSPIIFLQDFHRKQLEDVVEYIENMKKQNKQDELAKVIDRHNIDECKIDDLYKDVTLTITFYTGLESENGKGLAYKNAMGGKLIAGQSIAMPRDIPFGSKIEIDGYGTRICDDRGSQKYIKWLNKEKTHMKVDLYIGKNKSESDSQYWKRVNNMGVIRNVKAKLYDKEE